jgi:hypothetical protein
MVFIVIEGQISLKAHGQTVSPAKLLADYSAGDIIGAYDHGISDNIEHWLITRTNCLIIEITKPDFLNLWEAQKVNRTEVMINMTKYQEPISHFSPSTFYLLAYELFEW